jgi:hypothetical protein
MAVDWTNACERWAALREAYYSLLQGGNETMIRRKGPTGEEEVRFRAADLATLAAEMRAAESQCLGNDNPNRRSAIRGGAQRRC